MSIFLLNYQLPKILGNFYFVFYPLIFPSLIQSPITSLFFPSSAILANSEVSPLILSLFNCSFQKSGSLFCVSFLISYCCEINETCPYFQFSLTKGFKNTKKNYLIINLWVYYEFHMSPRKSPYLHKPHHQHLCAL